MRLFMLRSAIQNKTNVAAPFLNSLQNVPGYALQRG